jgi:peptide-methionine (S)-S-oxide reductase
MRFAMDAKHLVKATFAAGCFWGVEAAFRKLEGVEATRVGYTGGVVENPSYKQVSTGTTGHAEAVEVKFNPEKIPYLTLLEVFFRIHDPTTLNRQGVDVGSQYRSAIFYHSDGQHRAALQAKQHLEQTGRYDRPIVTEIKPAGLFFPAEEYHQRYYEKHGQRGCRLLR